MKTKTIEDALGRFDLISGVGDGETTACAMSLLCWLDGSGEWTDHPACTHPLIASQVISANDAKGTTSAMRQELVRAGKAGALDTWWVPVEVIAVALSADRDQEPPSQYDRALTMLSRIAEWKKSKDRPDLAGANLARANLARANLAGANLADANLADANLADVYLADANLARANLADANLARANLADAYLAGANLARAYLAGANLAGAYLAGAYLADVYLADANLARANLAGAKYANLEGARGNAYTTLPAGWKVETSGLIVRAK